MSNPRARMGSKSDILSGMTVTLSGKFTLPRRQFIRLIEEHGATVIVNVTKRVTHIITTPEDARNKTIRIQQALKYDLPLLDEAYIHACIEAGRQVEEDDYYIRVKGPNGKKVPSIRPPATKVEIESNENHNPRTESPSGNPGISSSSNNPGGTSSGSPGTPLRKSGRKSRSLRASPNNASSDLNLASRPKRRLDSGPEVEQPLKIMKRTPEIDPYANQPSHAKVVDDGFDNVYDVLLRLPYNDRDEFFIMQLIDASRHYLGKEKYVFFTRGGIVGSGGEMNTKIYRSKDKAVREFEKKFRIMTAHDWNNRRAVNKARGKFQYVPFGYTKRLFSGEEYDSDEVNTTTEMDVDAEADDEATTTSESNNNAAKTEKDDDQIESNQLKSQEHEKQEFEKDEEAKPHERSSMETDEKEENQENEKESNNDEMSSKKESDNKEHENENNDDDDAQVHKINESSVEQKKPMAMETDEANEKEISATKEEEHKNNENEEEKETKINNDEVKTNAQEETSSSEIGKHDTEENKSEQKIEQENNSENNKDNEKQSETT